MQDFKMVNYMTAKCQIYIINHFILVKVQTINDLTFLFFNVSNVLILTKSLSNILKKRVSDILKKCVSIL